MKWKVSGWLNGRLHVWRDRHLSSHPAGELPHRSDRIQHHDVRHEDQGQALEHHLLRLLLQHRLQSSAGTVDIDSRVHKLLPGVKRSSSLPGRTYSSSGVGRLGCWIIFPPQNISTIERYVLPPWGGQHTFARS